MQGQSLQINIPIVKVDEDQRKVWGYATVEELDKVGEVVSYDASKKAFSGWIGNIREMHSDVAVGKRIEVQYDDDKRGVWLGAYISESADGENAWVKVKEGILQGFSIGGVMKQFETKKIAGEDRVVITDYDLFEVSLVDNPACPSAVLQVVKSVDGHLNRTEHYSEAERKPAWWETRFKFADNQNVIKSANSIYNKNSMAKSKVTKNIFTADQLVDLATCLADFIYWQRFEGKDTSELESALENLKSAATAELKEGEDWPKPMAEAMQMACSALNITKKEELIKMAKDRKEMAKTVVGQEDRNAEGEVVTSATDNGRPLNDTAENAAANGVTQAGVVVENEDGTKTVQPLLHAEGTPQTGAGGGPSVTPEDEDEDEEEPEEPKAPAKPAADDKKPAAKDKEGKAVKPDMTKATKEADPMVKAILAGVGEMIEKATKPLKDELAVLKGQPAPSKAKGSYTEVDKVSKDAVAQAEGEQADHKARFDEITKRADELAQDPNKGTNEERIRLGVELRKLSRLMDPRSMQKHAELRAQFSTQK